MAKLSRNYRVKACRHCRQPFKPKHPAEKTCSDACRVADRKARRSDSVAPANPTVAFDPPDDGALDPEEIDAYHAVIDKAEDDVMNVLGRIAIEADEARALVADARGRAVARFDELRRRAFEPTTNDSLAGEPVTSFQSVRTAIQIGLNPLDLPVIPDERYYGTTTDGRIPVPLDHLRQTLDRDPVWR